MRMVIGKLSNTLMLVANAYIFYNMYLIKQVYFGYGVVNLMRQQEEIL